MTNCPNFSSNSSSEEPSSIFLVKLNYVLQYMFLKNPVTNIISVLENLKSLPLKIHIEIAQITIRTHVLQLVALSKV